MKITVQKADRKIERQDIPEGEDTTQDEPIETQSFQTVTKDAAEAILTRFHPDHTLKNIKVPALTPELRKGDFVLIITARDGTSEIVNVSHSMFDTMKFQN